MAFTKPDNNKSVWRVKPDVLIGTATTVKADFDKLLNDNSDDLITTINELEAATGAASIGAKSTSNADITVQAHISNVANPHGVTNAQVGLGNVTNDKQATEAQLTSHTSNTSNPHSVTKAQLGLGNVDPTSDADKPLSTAAITALGNKVDKVIGKSLVSDTEITKLAGIEAGAEANVNADWDATSGDAQILHKPTLGTAAAKDTGTTSGTIPILDANGKLDTSVIPSLAINSTSVVASQAAMLALDAQDGDVCIRSDQSKTYILQTTPASTLSNWIALPTPTDLVLSVCGMTGTVTLTADDVGALDTSDIENSLTSTSTTKALSAAQGKALADVIGTYANINAWFTGKSADTLVKCLNALIAQIGTTTFDSWFGSLTDFSACVNLLATNKVTSTDISAVRYDTGSSKFQYTLDDVNWIDLTGAQGIQGKGYNPRGDWVSGGSYVNNTTTIDAVVYNGTSYYCKVSVSGTTAPSADTTHWGVLATSGTLATGADILLTGYSKAASEGVVSNTDTVNVGIGKLEKNLDGKASTSHKSTHAAGQSDALAAADIGAVPTTRTVNGKALSANITLTASDVTAAAASHVTTLVTDSGGVHGLATESGTFHPTIYGSTAAGTQTYSTQNGTYEKIGNIAHVTGRVILASTSGATGEIMVGGFPFTRKSTASGRNGAKVSYIGNLTNTTLIDLVGCYVPTSVAGICISVDGTPTSNLTSSTQIDFEATYEI